MTGSTVFLHIGLPKTGTTVVQRTMAASPRFLRENGIAYPSAGRHAIFSDHGHHLLALHFMRDRRAEWPAEISDEEPGAAWDQLQATLSTGDHRYTFLSSEWFAFDVHRSADLHQIRDRLGRHDVKVVLVFRHVLDLVNALYVQRVRDGFEGTIDDYIALAWPHLDWAALSNRWGDVFGHENILMCNYEQIDRKRYVEQLLSFILPVQLIGQELLAVSEKYNSRLPPELIELILLINKSGIKSIKRANLVDDIIAAVAEVGLNTRRKNYLSERATEALLAHCKNPLAMNKAPCATAA